MSERTRRQELILTLIARKPLRTQEELLAELERHRVFMTQSTLSRELKGLGIAKGPDGRGGYRYLAAASGSEGSVASVAPFVVSVERSQNLIVVKTPPGNAQGVARALDQADWDEVMGTIAGDDAILMICYDTRVAGRVEKRLNLLARRG